VLKIQEDTLKKLSGDGKKICVNMGNDYAVPYCSLVTNMDLRGSEYTILDECVPFFQLAVHGRVNYTGYPVNICGNAEDEILYSELLNRFKYVYEPGCAITLSVDTTGAVTFFAPKTNYGYPFVIASNYSGYEVSLYFLPNNSKYDPETKTLNLYAYIFGLDGEPWNYVKNFESFTFSGDGIPWVKLPEPGDEGGEVGGGE
jgi:hypothetical protein